MNQMINGTFWSQWTLTINKVLSWKMYSHYMTERQTFVCNLRLHFKKSVTYDQNNATLFKVVHKSVLHWIFVTLGGVHEGFPFRCENFKKIYSKLSTLTRTYHKEKLCILFYKSWSLCEIPLLPLVSFVKIFLCLSITMMTVVILTGVVSFLSTWHDIERRIKNNLSKTYLRNQIKIHLILERESKLL